MCRCSGRRSSRGRAVDIALAHAVSAFDKVVGHLCIQLFLRLLGTSVAAVLTVTATVTATVTTTVTTTITATITVTAIPAAASASPVTGPPATLAPPHRTPRPRDTAVVAAGSCARDITVDAAPCCRCQARTVVFVFSAVVVVVGFWSRDALGQGSAGANANRRAVSSPAAAAATGNGQANGLALGVGAVKLADGLARILVGFVGDVGDALGAAGAVVDKVDGDNGADTAEQAVEVVAGQVVVQVLDAEAGAAAGVGRCAVCAAAGLASARVLSVSLSSHGAQGDNRETKRERVPTILVAVVNPFPARSVVVSRVSSYRPPS